MSESRHYIYLHTNGQVLFKHASVVESTPGGAVEYFDSPFVVRWWWQRHGESLVEFEVRVKKEAIPFRKKVKE